MNSYESDSLLILNKIINKYFNAKHYRIKKCCFPEKETKSKSMSNNFVSIYKAELSLMSTFHNIFFQVLIYLNIHKKKSFNNQNNNIFCQNR